MKITPDQCREAREMLGWSQIALALQVGLSLGQLKKFEGGRKGLRESEWRALRSVFEFAGVEFSFESGVSGANVKSRERQLKTIIPAQWRAGRALLDWSQIDLAKYLGVPVQLIITLEAGYVPVPHLLRERARAALEVKGVLFIEEDAEGPGVRLRKTS